MCAVSMLSVALWCDFASGVIDCCTVPCDCVTIVTELYCGFCDHIDLTDGD